MNNKKKILLIVALIVILIVAIAAGYTFSKYFKNEKGDVTATIATWAFKANAGQDSQKLGDIVLKPEGGTKIAPGTSGQFKIKVDATGSEVDVDYTVSITQEKLPANMQFKLLGDKEYLPSMSALASKIQGTLTKDNPTKTYDIVWNWPITTPGDGNTVETSKDMQALNLGNLGFHIEVLGEQAN